MLFIKFYENYLKNTFQNDFKMYAVIYTKFLETLLQFKVSLNLVKCCLNERNNR